MKTVLYLSLLLCFSFSCDSPQPRTIPLPNKPSENVPRDLVKPTTDSDLIYLEELAVLPESPQPILVVMHGYGSNERDLLELGKSLNDRFFVVSVRAPIDLGNDRYAWFGRGSSADDKVVAANADKVITAINGLPRTANSQGSGKDDKIRSPLFIAGFSQGGRMAIEVARRAKPGLIQGAIAFSPAAFKADGLTIPTLITHGRADKVVPFKLIEPVAKKMIQDGSPVQFKPFEGRHSIPPVALQSAKRWADAFLAE